MDHSPNNHYAGRKGRKGGPNKEREQPRRDTRLHPCVVQYGQCNYGERCHFSGLPGDTCLNYLRGTCTFKNMCRYRHDVGEGSCIKPVEKVLEGVGTIRPVGQSEKLAVIDPTVKTSAPTATPMVTHRVAPRVESTITIDPSQTSANVVTCDRRYEGQYREEKCKDVEGHWDPAEGGGYSLWGGGGGGGGLFGNVAWDAPKASLDVQDFPALGSKPRKNSSDAKKLECVTRGVPGVQGADSNPDEVGVGVGALRSEASSWMPPSASPWTRTVQAPAQQAPATSQKPVVIMDKSRATPVPLQSGPQQKGRAQLHPCLVQMGSCKYGEYCAYAKLPAYACLPFLQGHCKFGDSCRNVHTRSEKGKR